MTQHLEPLFGAFSTDQAIARAIGLQPGVTAKPVFQATGSMTPMCIRSPERLISSTWKIRAGCY